MMFKNKLASLLGMGFAVAILQGCNGTSGENGSDPFGDGNGAPDPAPVAAISLTVLDKDCNVVTNRTNLGDALCVQASLTLDGVAMSDEIVQFSTTLGSFSVTNRLTNAQGVAQGILLSSDANLGAGQISAVFNNGTNSANAATNFEILAATEQPDENAQLSLSLLNGSGEPANRVKVGDSLAVSAVLLDAAGQPIADQIVSFQASLGATEPSAVLTNDQGLATTLFKPDGRLGAGTLSATTTINELAVINSQNIEVQAADAVTDDMVRIGTFEEGTFIEGVLGVDGVSQSESVSLSAGGTIGLVVALVDSNDVPITNGLPVTFSSVCAAAANALIDSTALSINGIARSTFQDVSCAGANGNDDLVTASVTVNGQQLSISRAINIEAEALGAIRFINAQPENIVLNGAGGQNAETVSTVTFQVNGALGNPLPQQAVNFTLNTEIGGLSLSPAQGITNSEGQVSTRVTAGNVPTAVRVTAAITADGNTISTQSDLLSVNTGLPDQNSISLSATDLNPEAFNIDGQTVGVTARLADSFNNPVPDGTAVSFITEGGIIEPSCTTVNGVCSVVWTSSIPRPLDHRVTILATAVGHESLFDSNGNNQYEAADGPGVQGESGSGLDTFIPSATGFSDLPEAWLDANENGVLDGAEIFLDFNASGSYDTANGVFDGPQCADNCGASSVHVRRAFALVMSSSAALMSFTHAGDELTNNTSAPVTTPVANIARGSSYALQLVFSDTAEQPIASGSQITISASQGELTGTTSLVMPRTNRPGESVATVILTNNLDTDDAAINSTINATITSPGGLVSSLTVIVTLD